MKPVLALVLCGAMATSAFAATSAAPARAPPTSDDALAAKLAGAAELADQNRRSEALNAEVNAKNRAVDALNGATRAAFEKAMADYKAALARHDTQVKAMVADAAKVQTAYQQQMDEWRAAVAACKAGDVSKCQVPAPAVQTASTRPPR
jgi:hypothetical protein